MKILILFILTIFFIGCGGGSSSETSANNENIKDNTKSAFNMPNLNGTTNPIEEINHLK